ncbi:MAG: heparinase II/III-family protein [Cytophagales bacterium]|nr:heparinase II/III-family protein [Cytophagales bacterium]
MIHKIIGILAMLLFTAAIRGSSYTRRDILYHKSQSVDLAGIITMDDSWVYYPSYSDRSFWSEVPPALAKAYIKKAERYLDYNWPSVKATDYLEFIRSGDRRQEIFGAPKGALVSLMMGELMEGQGRFLDQIINGVWFYCEQGWWGWSAHMYLQKAPIGLPDVEDHTIDLNVGDVANLLSWAWYYFHEKFDRVHPLISTRLHHEIQKKVIDPYLERTDFWWMGIEDQSHINNWNPWINYNMLNCILLMEKEPDRKIAGIKKIIRSLDVFINSYPDDGACNEGPTYWGAASADLFKSLHLLKKMSGGKLDVFDHQLIKNMGKYIYKVYIHYPYFVNFGDADAKTSSYPLDIYMYGKAIQDPVMQKFGAFLAKKSGWGQQPFAGNPDGQINRLMMRDELLNADVSEALIGHFWLPDTEVAGARDAKGSHHGFYFAAKGGFNAEGHNHNDAGAFVLYYDGRPVLVDVGREAYTAKTFSGDRYKIWTMQSQYHNLPRINGIDQAPGKAYKAHHTTFTNSDRQAVFSTDISDAYPKKAKVDVWKRKYVLKKNKSFEIIDAYRLHEVKDKPTSLHFMTCSKAGLLRPGTIKLDYDSGTLYLHYDRMQLEPVLEQISIADEKLKQYWPEGLTRIVLSMKKVRLKEKVTVKISPGMREP